MSLDYIKRELEKGNLLFGTHLVEKMISQNITLEQVIEVIYDGKVNKKRPDEQSKSRFTKYTLTKGNISVVIKDSKIPFVITAFRRK